MRLYCPEFKRIPLLRNIFRNIVQMVVYFLGGFKKNFFYFIYFFKLLNNTSLKAQLAMLGSMLILSCR